MKLIKEKAIYLPDECKRQDIVRVDGDKPVAVFAVRVWMRKVGRQNEPRGIGEIASTRSWGKTQRFHMSNIWVLVTHEESLLLKHAAQTSAQHEETCTE